MKVKTPLDGLKIRLTEDVKFESGEILPKGTTGTVMYGDIAITLWYMCKMDGAEGGVFEGARYLTDSQFEAIN